MSLDLVLRNVTGRIARHVAVHSPAMILTKLIWGRQRYTTLVVVADSGPGSSQNILSTPWCCETMDGPYARHDAWDHVP